MNKTTIKKLDLSNVKKGDLFTRNLGGEVLMPVVVGDVDEEYIWTGSLDGIVPPLKGIGWQFRKDTSCEIDEDLGWDGITVSGSFLTKKENG